MSHIRQSLLDYLKTKDPHLFVIECQEGRKSKSNSKSGKTTWAKPQVIKDWEDFKFEALSSIYGGALREVLGRHFDLEAFPIPEKPFCQIHSEDSVTSLVVKWNQSMVSRALSTTQDELDRHLSCGKIYMYRGSQAKYPGNDSGYRPDWAGVKSPPTKSDPTTTMPDNILPGDSKPSRNWSSDQVERRPVQNTLKASQWYLPLSQVYTYCIAANARYGYLITDSELVVLRLRPNIGAQSSGSRLKSLRVRSILNTDPRKTSAVDNLTDVTPSTPASRTKSNGMLEIKAIPWQDDADGQSRVPHSLTINLALWWLHIMAADKHDIEDTYPPLRKTTWNTNVPTQATSLAQLSDLRISSSRGRLKRGRTGNMDSVNDSEQDYNNPSSPTKRQTRSSGKAARSAV